MRSKTLPHPSTLPSTVVVMHWKRGPDSCCFWCMVSVTTGSEGRPPDGHVQGQDEGPGGKVSRTFWAEEHVTYWPRHNLSTYQPVNLPTCQPGNRLAGQQVNRVKDTHYNYIVMTVSIVPKVLSDLRSQLRTCIEPTVLYGKRSIHSYVLSSLLHTDTGPYSREPP